MIEQDKKRFQSIVKGRVRKGLRKYMSSQDMFGRKGKETVSIPIHSLDPPRLRYGKNEKGLGANGEGEGKGESAAGPKAGNQSGNHVLEVEVSIDELAQILGEELELPRIQPRGNQESPTEKNKYTGINTVGPESLRHNKRTFRRALMRTLSEGNYDPKKPVIIPRKEDRRYRSVETIRKPQSAAVIIYMMDVSGSMGQEQKEIVRSQAFWLDAWIKHNYNKVETRFIIHDASAREVDRHTFFHTRESGGTLISSAYQLCLNIIENEYSPTEWNIYPFHFSDGDNWSSSDSKKCLEMLEGSILPKVNQFSYAQVDSPYGSGEFIKWLDKLSDERVVSSKVPNKDAIMDSIRELMKGGR